MGAAGVGGADMALIEGELLDEVTARRELHFRQTKDTALQLHALLAREQPAVGIVGIDENHCGIASGPRWILPLFRLDSNMGVTAESAFAFTRRSEIYQATCWSMVR